MTEYATPQELLWATLNTEGIEEGALYAFAADCAEYTYLKISHHDPSGVLRSVIEAVRSGDSGQRDRARQTASRFVRRMARSGSSKQTVRAAQAVRGCSLPSGQAAAIAAAASVISASETVDEDVAWMIERLPSVTSES